MENKKETESTVIGRKRFLEWTISAAAGLAVSSFPNVSFAGTRIFTLKANTLAACQTISPLEMAQGSDMVRNAYFYITKTVNEIMDINLRNTVAGIIANPAPTFMNRYMDRDSRKSIWQRLTDAGLLDHGVSSDSLFPPYKDPNESPQQFISAPGSGYDSHHPYPGGLSAHVATNIKITLSLYQTYNQIFAYKVDKDVILAAQALHDLHKPWVFQWQDNDSSLPELIIAGTGAHHIFSLAEVMYRALPAKVIIAQACAHNHPGSPQGEADVVRWLTAASMIAGKDPVKEGYLARGGRTLPEPYQQEGYIVHLGDHDWVLSVTAAQETIAVLAKIARKEYGLPANELKTRRFHSFRNYVASQISMMNLHHLLCTGGETAVAEAVRKVVSPA
ncbi:Hypothetical protein LUCI_2665 [Lucifera butyrica]|uniref:HD/PDEase domain-containing protein n=1 Tax=Lucifera butyrica TaxID=1351585 RepID=A0A498R411_9FIRM|nr:TAT (twin-arginine translocation) pathway signal sequence [Lucifera butyrica]VBB07416.1 Hypothetical protein LUCI_2665 [Lucifera butyrica]